LSRYARTLVMIATPHRGTSLARLGPGATARHMRPGSPLLADLRTAESSGRARWVTYYSDADRVVPVGSAALTDPRLDVTNVLVPGRGHMSIASDPAVVASVVDQLLVVERGAGIPVPARAVPDSPSWLAAGAAHQRRYSMEADRAA
jgi:pimeloyl-ACP methyl ester carboxylesterase